MNGITGELCAGHGRRLIGIEACASESLRAWF